MSITNNTNNYLNKDEAENSYISNIYCSDNEGSKLLIIPETNNIPNRSSFVPLASSSPIEKNNSDNILKPELNKVKTHLNDSNKTISSYSEFTSNKINKSTAQKYNNTSPLKNVTNILNTKNIVDQLHALDQIELLNIGHLTQTKINNQTLHSNIIVSNNYKNVYTLNQTKCVENDRIKTDLSELFQMELSLKTFSGNMVPYLNSLKHDMLQLMNNCIYISDKQTKESNNVNDIIKKLHKTMKLHTNTCIDIKSNEKILSTIPFVTININSLYLLNSALEHVDTMLEPVKLLIKNNPLKDQKEDKISTEKYTFREGKYFNSYIHDSKSLKPDESIIDNRSEGILSTGMNASDSFDRIRKLNRSISLLPLSFTNTIFQEFSQAINNKEININTLLPTNNDINVYTPLPAKEMLIDTLLPAKDINIDILLPTEDVSIDTLLPAEDINIETPVPAKDINIDTLVPANKTISISSEIKSYDDNQVQNKKQYWLRCNPKPTKRYTVPLKCTSTSNKRKSSKHNDMFISEGSGNKKVILQYKFHSVLHTNQLMKKICPESKKCEFNNNSPNTSILNIPNMKTRKNDKPCSCGIFPSQVPSSWNNSLHESLHKNLHKLQFKILTDINVVGKINNNGFLYDIIMIDENHNNDKNLKLILKNIQDYITLELDFPKRNINNLKHLIFLAVIPNSSIIGYLEIEPLENACIYENNQLSENLISVKFGISKLWVMVKYRKCGVATKLIKHFCNTNNLKSNDIAFAYHGSYGIQFIKTYFVNNSVLIY